MKNKNTFMVIGHPGHELRAYRWMELMRPMVFVITDGSGSLSEGRVQSTEKVVMRAGAVKGSVFGALKDNDFYQDLLSINVTRFADVLSSIYESIKQTVATSNSREITMVGDAVEGYNTAHDMTRYMINLLCSRLREDGYEVLNYAFNLVDNPQVTALHSGEGDWVIQLDEADFQRKFEAAKSYPELADEVKMAIAQSGKEAFKNEVLMLQAASSQDISEPKQPIYYETYGRQRVNEGKYKDFILFSTHVLPFVEALRDRFLAY